MNLIRTNCKRVAMIFTALTTIAFGNLSFAKTDSLDVASALVGIASRNDALIFGEQHDLRDARLLVLETLRIGLKNGSIDTFATEYVHEEDEQAFQNYLVDENAITESPAEKAFFQRSLDRRYVWLKDEHNKDFFRSLRKLKLEYPHLKICGIDVEGSTDLDIRRTRLEGMTPALKKAAQKAFRISIEKMIADRYSNYDRETRMAEQTVKCINNSKHALVHIGMFHAWSLRYDPTIHESVESKNKPGWRATTYFIKALMPSIRMRTVATLQVARAANTSLENMNVLLAEAYAYLEKSRKPGLILLESLSIEPALKKILLHKDDDGTTTPLSTIWDFLVFGPEGEYSAIFD